MSSAIRMPGDFEPQSAIILGCNELLPHCPRLLVDLLAPLLQCIPVIAIVNDEAQRMQLLTLACDWGLPAQLIHFICLPVIGMWVRDYGPVFVQKPDGELMILDARYAWQDRPADDQVPTELAALLRLPVNKVPLLMEGGNLLSNGQGLCVTTNGVLSRNGLPDEAIGRLANAMGHYYGFDQCLFLRPLLGEPTAHVDMFATFLAPDLIVVGEYDPKVDPVNADILDQNAAMLSGIPTPSGPMRVVRIPMPSNRGSVWRTYTNVIFANDLVIMPTYGRADGELRERALDVYRQWLPGRTVIGVDASSIIEQGGSLRCVSLGIPHLDRLGWLRQANQQPDGGLRSRLTA